MDNITHTLFAATLARTSVGRAGRGTTTALILASNAPDIDIVTTAGGVLKYLEWHRGPTHGPLGIVGLGLITAALVSVGLRIFDRRRSSEHAPFRMLVAVSIIGALCHVLMDLPTSYGTRPLSPFSWRWYAWDWMPIIDIYLLGALAAGLLIGQYWPATRRQAAAIALAFLAGNYGVRAISHERALALAPRAFGPILPGRCETAPPRPLIDTWPLPPVTQSDSSGRCLIELAALPDFGTPFRWRLVAHLSDAYETHDVNLLDPRLQQPPATSEAIWRLTSTYSNEWTPAVFQAASTRPVKVFLGFSRFPAVRSVVGRDGVTTVRWLDVRFAAGPQPPQPPDRGQARAFFFGATVRVAPTGEILN